MYAFAKRCLDVSLAGALLLLTAPVVMVACIAILIMMGRPVFFRQVRPGRDAEPFTLIKLRTMRPVKREEDADEDRLTPLGRFLRRTSIDELPQLWNVLRGDMSLVGPRPLLQRYLPYYSERERLRHTVLPGLTGWSQIHGRNRLSWEDRLELDAWYVEHRSFLLDLRILWRSVSLVASQRDVVDAPDTLFEDLDVERRHRMTPPTRETAH